MIVRPLTPSNGNTPARVVRPKTRALLQADTQATPCCTSGSLKTQPCHGMPPSSLPTPLPGSQMLMDSLARRTRAGTPRRGYPTGEQHLRHALFSLADLDRASPKPLLRAVVAPGPHRLADADRLLGPARSVRVEARDVALVVLARHTLHGSIGFIVMKGIT